MKASRYFPFERNRFFYGKLLTVRDFDSEQKYFNDKRRMLNRLLYGSGVVAGLQVVFVDETSVSLEAGVALDSFGREIVVPSPVKLKLSMLDGFSNNEYAKNVYLCVAYDEKGKEPVHSIANSHTHSADISEYNRIMEGYRVFIEEKAPDPSQFDFTDLIEQTQVLYDDGYVRVFQTAPRYVNPGEEFEIVWTLEKTLQTPPLSFGCELEAEHLTFVNKEDWKIEFIEPEGRQHPTYHVRLAVRAESQADIEAQIRAIGQVRLTIGEQTELLTLATQPIQITKRAIADHILEDYQNRSFEKVISSPSSQEAVYLAKISLFQAGPTYIIEQIEPVPFQQPIWTSPLLRQLQKVEKQNSHSHWTAPPFSVQSEVKQLTSDEQPSLSISYEPSDYTFSFALGLPPMRGESTPMASGIVEIPIEQFSRMGKNFFAKAERSYFSEEIEHGLGQGNVCVTVGVEEQKDDAVTDMLHRNEKVFFGDQDVFRYSEFEPGLPYLATGVIVYPRKGTFRIGVKLYELSDRESIRLRWWAYKKE